MPGKNLLAAGTVLLLGFSMVVHADTPTTKPGKSTSKPRLFEPWSKMTSLSDDQRGKIHDIHAKVLDAKREIDAKEESDIMALLSPQQKAEKKKIEDDEKVASKSKKPSDMKQD